MRSILAILVLLGVLIVPLPPVEGGDVGARPYLATYGWLTDAYNYQNSGFIGMGTYNCEAPETYIWPLVGNDVGCIGGTLVYTSEAWAHYEPGTSFADIQAQGVTLYKRHALTVVDDLSGSNVMAAVCNYNTLRNTEEGRGQCDNGEVDNSPDVFTFACGVTIDADSTGIHDGNFWTAAFVFTVSVEVTVNQVCIGTSGSTSVVYS